jgi:DNA-directed RNA polymerase I, II, and III subunit RPABC1
MSQIHQMRKSSKDIIKTLLKNSIKMLIERKLLKSDNDEKSDNSKYVEKYLKELKIHDEEMVYSLPFENSNKPFIIKILPQKIISIKKSSNISIFLNKYKDNHKIIIVKNISAKTEQNIHNNYENTEIFLEKNLMFNLIDHILVPKHEIFIRKNEDAKIKNFLKIHNCKSKGYLRINENDPVARYYNMKAGDICKVYRPSETSGFVIAYRCVVKN